MNKNKISVSQWGYKAEVYPKYQEVTEMLFDFLPHGSGINYDWQISQRGYKFTCHNRYDAMTGSGFYCHIHDFTVKVVYHPETGKFEVVDFDLDIVDCDLGYHYEDCPNYENDESEYDCDCDLRPCGEGLEDYLSNLFYFGL